MHLFVAILIKIWPSFHNVAVKYYKSTIIFEILRWYFFKGIMEVLQHDRLLGLRIILCKIEINKRFSYHWIVCLQH